MNRERQGVKIPLLQIFLIFRPTFQMDKYLGLPTLLSQQFLSRKSSLAKSLLTNPLSVNSSLKQLLSHNFSLANPLSLFLSHNSSLGKRFPHNFSLAEYLLTIPLSGKVWEYYLVKRALLWFLAQGKCFLNKIKLTWWSINCSILRTESLRYRDLCWSCY